ncbi:bZIP transcription factor [Sporobolomyces salmoneus]|uniref:bZIP transcription factor n=1 Tax=Sporobolomyces salmoneus TaxID=183962 RepID=UPI00317BDA85
MSSNFGNSPHHSLSSASERPKRRTTTTFDHSDQEEGDNDYTKQPRSKRHRVQRAVSDGLDDSFEGGGGGSLGGTAESGGRSSGGAAPKALSEKEKDARKQARMIRNRNAAQASRDRKKEHTMFLERRVAELEARLAGTAVVPPHPLSISTASYTAPSSSSSSPLKLSSRSQRSTSVFSSVSSSEATRIADLEEENEVLRTQLHIEQTESARLRARLELLSTTSTPYSNYEPTFAFNTANLKPLPQPEELAFVEAREREKRTPPLHLAQIPLPSLPLHNSTPTRVVGGPSTRGRSIPAAEAVQLSQSTSSSTSSSSSSLTRSPSLSASISSTPGSVASLDLASTPPSTESYLEDLDHFAPPPLWNEWVKSDPDSKEEESNVTSGLAFVDFDFLSDGPAVASC